MAQAAQSLPKLTRKQRDVMALVADNRTSKEIAARLDISESAVNQRIEMIRARLGGLPRGELARLYRLEYASDSSVEAASTETWQKIHLPQSNAINQGPLADGIPSSRSVGSHSGGTGYGDGSQLTAFFFSEENAWPGRDDRTPAFARYGLIGLIVAAALAVAVGVTQFIGPVGGG